MVDLQKTAWELYTVLRSQRADWGGTIILHHGMDEDGMALAVASNLCGAVFLGLEPDSQKARAVMKAGFCDFLVNTLDEALRAMKNEVRKHRPLTVILEGDAVAHLAEMKERGVFPQLLVTRGEEPGLAAEQVEELEAMLAKVEGAHSLLSMRITAANGAGLRSVDRAIAEIIAEGDPRRAWAVGAPRFFVRPVPVCRYVWLDEPELDAMTALLPEDATIAPLSHLAS